MAVFAVAITLLALETGSPRYPGHGRLTDQLSEHWPSFAAYVVSFLTIGIIWLITHALFKNVADRSNRPLLFLNLLLLFFRRLDPVRHHNDRRLLPAAWRLGRPRRGRDLCRCLPGHGHQLRRASFWWCVSGTST